MIKQPLDLKTDSDLMARLMDASKHQPSAAELQQQRISFIYGTMGKSSDVTRAQIEDALNQKAGITGATSDPV